MGTLDTAVTAQTDTHTLTMTNNNLILINRQEFTHGNIGLTRRSLHRQTERQTDRQRDRQADTDHDQQQPALINRQEFTYGDTGHGGHCTDRHTLTMTNRNNLLLINRHGNDIGHGGHCTDRHTLTMANNNLHSSTGMGMTLDTAVTAQADRHTDHDQ